MLPVVTGEFRAGADPTLRFAPSGVAVAELRCVASSRKKQDDGTWVDDKTVWLTVVGFKQLAENMAESITQGDLVSVTGRLQVEDWEDKDGNKRTQVKIMADHIGPSLARATAKVTRTQRNESSGGGGGNNQQQQRQQSEPASDPWATGGAQSDEPPF